MRMKTAAGSGAHTFAGGIQSEGDTARQSGEPMTVSHGGTAAPLYVPWLFGYGKAEQVAAVTGLSPVPYLGFAANRTPPNENKTHDPSRQEMEDGRADADWFDCAHIRKSDYS